MFDAPGPRRLLDRAVLGVIVLVGAASIAVLPISGAARVARPVALVVCAVALLLRHRRPVLTLAAVLAVTLAVNYGPIVVLPTLLAVLTVTTDSEPPTVVTAGAVSAVLVILAPALHGRPLESLAQIVSRLVAIGMAVAFGLYLRARAAHVEGLRDRARRLERERELLAIQAVADERVRIARELHDVVAHNVSLMVVQAQAAAAGGALTAPQLTALERIGDLGREAMSEMHRMLGVLRVGDGGTLERAPQPGVGDLGQLVASTRQAGIEAELQVVGDRHELPPGVELSAYRIVQEALTNVIRHAGARRAVVTVSYGPAALELTVSDDGRGATANGHPAPGHGLVGMRERVALFGGELAAGGRADGPGYRVHASLPVS